MREIARKMVFVISGWRLHDKPMSFPIENGAHAGPGINETHAFALLPTDISLIKPGATGARALDLNRCITEFTDPNEHYSKFNPTIAVENRHSTIRVMTYNVHSCIGVDGQLSPNRIARLIAQYEPDIIALQELDVRRRRTDEIDQAHTIAKALEMNFHFHPSFTVEEEQYGNAILSRFPAKIIKTGTFPLVPGMPKLEPRGVIWSEISRNNHKMQIIDTHLGLKNVERRIQIDSLLGTEWLDHPECKVPIIVCGDFNTSPNSNLYKKFTERFHDVQVAASNHRPGKTWFSHYPVSRIDHIFISPGISVNRVSIPSNALSRKASDHLPLIVDLELSKVQKESFSN